MGANEQSWVSRRRDNRSVRTKTKRQIGSRGWGSRGWHRSRSAGDWGCLSAHPPLPRQRTSKLLKWPINCLRNCGRLKTGYEDLKPPCGITRTGGPSREVVVSNLARDRAAVLWPGGGASPAAATSSAGALPQSAVINGDRSRYEGLTSRLSSAVIRSSNGRPSRPYATNRGARSPPFLSSGCRWMLAVARYRGTADADDPAVTSEYRRRVEGEVRHANASLTR